MSDRIQDLQRRSFHGLQQVQAHQTVAPLAHCLNSVAQMLQNSLDKLQLLVADGQAEGILPFLDGLRAFHR